ncbi:alpha/beta fold hydrolase [Streptomyces inhibens]|uniref:alpha/beta fold hydrolase n=1 Tax=Streptomyces inhibens TaxID=2293571 RepID=UPI0036CE4C29
MDDLASTYLDLLEDLGLRDVLVLGSSFGGRVASEMAVRERGHRISHLVLLDAIGPEIPGYEVQMPGRGGHGDHSTFIDELGHGLRQAL